MARLSRLAVAGQAHLILLSGLPGRPLCIDDDDRRRFLAALRDAASQQRTAVHAHVLLDAEALLLATPENRDGISRLIQELGRRYVAGFNRRHGLQGPLWEGRFRATIVQPGPATLEAMLFVDLHPVHAGLVQSAGDYPWSSARHHLGQLRDPAVTDAAVYWQLGNTPFDRELGYRRLLDEGLASRRVAQFMEAGRKGWAIGDEAFLALLAAEAGRPVRPRRRGRPAKRAAAN
jgi:putative transposase